MYYYAEFLRGQRALRVVAIILAIFLALAIIFRLWALREHNGGAIAAMMQSSPTAHAVTITLPDGTVRTTIDDPFKHVHAVIDRSGSGLHIDATLPSANVPRHGYSGIFDASVNRNSKTGMAHLILSSVGHDRVQLWVGILFAIASVIGLVAATMLAGTLAKENDGHLEIAWTKPVSRERLALASIAVDMITIVIAQCVTVVAIVLAVMLFSVPAFYTNSLTLPTIGLALLLPLAWYACLTAFSASLKRGLGMVVGLGWLAAIITPAVAQGTLRATSDIGVTIHAISQAVAYIDPISYGSMHGSLESSGIAMSTEIGSIPTSALFLLLLTIVYVALAVVQWRRVEA